MYTIHILPAAPTTIRPTVFSPHSHSAVFQGLGPHICPQSLLVLYTYMLQPRAIVFNHSL